MYVELGEARLRAGERVTVARVDGPDREWAARVEALLAHKGDPWTWQNSALLRETTGLTPHFFVLHRRGHPFANIMVVEHAGVGLLGHVWTDPADRRTGASSILMEIALADFQERGGRTMYLGTDYDSPPWHYYRRRGFEPVLPGSGTMFWTVPGAPVSDRFGGSAAGARNEPLGWPHWPLSIPLFLHPEGGVARLSGGKLYGRTLSEGGLLPLLRAQLSRPAGAPPAAVVLRAADGPALLGLASVLPDPLWPGSGLVDLFCLPTGWEHSADLLRALEPTGYDRLIAFADATQGAKHAALQAAGFRVQFILPRWISAPPSHPASTDVILFLRN